MSAYSNILESRFNEAADIGIIYQAGSTAKTKSGGLRGQGGFSGAQVETVG